MAQNVYFE
ncbi:hypothetical protein D030_3760A, partial [Vibrio parahaemolyticus AQ3810]